MISQEVGVLTLCDVGMIAEEVGKVLPEIVSYEENGIDATGMDYSKMTPLLVEAVNTLRAENDDLPPDIMSYAVGLQFRFNRESR